jgi:putative DNA primase/helicase
MSECSKQDGMYEPKFEERLDADPYIMAFNNGVWDAHQMKFRPIEKTDYISYSTGYDYNPHVSTEEVKRILRGMFEDDGTFMSLVEVLAASMFGGNREEIFLILQGAGRNGKGLVLDLVVKTFGDEYTGSIDESYYTTYQKHSESGTPMLMGLRGKRLGITDETHDEAKFITRTMKRDTGGGMVKGRALYSNTVMEFRLFYTPLLSTNYEILWTDVDVGLMKRAVKIHFPYFFAKVGDKKYDPNDPLHKLADLTLKDRVKNDVSLRQAFANLILESYKSYKERGHLLLSDTVKATTEEYTANLNPALQWANDNLEKGAQNTVTPLKKAYDQFLEDTGTAGIGLTKFTRLLKTNWEIDRRHVEGSKQSALIGWRIIGGDISPPGAEQYPADGVMA